jgi:hypothetical protein
MERLLVLCVLLFTGCCHSSRGPEVNLPTTASECAAAQNNLEKVCPIKAKTLAGKDFRVLCTEDAAKTPPIDLKPNCVAAARSCEEFDKCLQN